MGVLSFEVDDTRSAGRPAKQADRRWRAERSLLMMQWELARTPGLPISLISL
jgi:hypothetical protein